MSSRQQEELDYVNIRSDPITLTEAVDFVRSDEAGAISTFSGTTKKWYNGKLVLKLEYEAYIPMAEKEMKKICIEIREKWNVIKISMIHRIGVVDIGKESIVIAISSVSRSDSLQAVQYAIDNIKFSVPVWKKEFYEDGSIWKENAETRHTCKPANPANLSHHSQASSQSHNHSHNHHHHPHHPHHHHSHN